MERKRGFTVNWGALLIVYVAIVFATTMVVLTTGSANAYYVLLLAAGIPVYAVTTRSLMREAGRAPASGQEALPDANLVSFPERRPATMAADIVRGAAETRRRGFRKAG